MNYLGTWVFHSVAARDDDCNLIYLDADAYLNYPMPYVDEDDPEAVADEIKERKNIIGSRLRIAEDGKIYQLMAIPEGASQADVDAAVAAGEFTLMDGMLCDGAVRWEQRGDDLWAEFGMSEDGWDKISDEDGLLNVLICRYVKQD